MTLPEALARVEAMRENLVGAGGKRQREDCKALALVLEAARSDIKNRLQA